MTIYIHNTEPYFRRRRLLVRTTDLLRPGVAHLPHAPLPSRTESAALAAAQAVTQGAGHAPARHPPCLGLPLTYL